MRNRPVTLPAGPRAERLTEPSVTAALGAELDGSRRSTDRRSMLTTGPFRVPVTRAAATGSP